MALAAKIDSRCHAVGPQNFRSKDFVLPAGIHGIDKLVPQRPVVVAGQIGDRLLGRGKFRSAATRPTADTLGQPHGVKTAAIDKAQIGFSKSAFDCVTGIVAEGAGGHAAQIVFAAQLRAGDGGSGSGAPGLAEN